MAAVDVDRDHLPGLFGDLGKDPAYGGGLPGPRGAAEDGGESAPALEGGPEDARASSWVWASRWWRWSGTNAGSKASGWRKRVWSLRRRGRRVIEESGEEEIVKGEACAG
nr:hypothetical protein [Methanoculleus marisnigri]